MSGIFSNKSARSFDSAYSQALDERFPNGSWNANSEDRYALYQEFEAKRPIDASEIGFGESRYTALRNLLSPVIEADGFCRNIDAALTILRSAWISQPENREMICRMGQWVKTVSEFA